MDEALDQVRAAPFILDAIRLADEVTLAAAQAHGSRTCRALTAAALDPSDHVTAIAAVHALGRVLDDGADASLSELLSHDQQFLREHAAWALASRLPRLDAVGRLVAVVADGGFPGMLAQRTLQHWAGSASDYVALALEGAYRQGSSSGARSRLVETLGLVPGRLAARVIDQVAVDASEASQTRAAAIAALGDRGDDSARQILDELVACGLDELGAVTELALLDAAGPEVDGRRGSGTLRVAQMFLHADLDRQLSRVGAGDNGGIATLLVRLGEAMAAEETIDEMVTISRGDPRSALSSVRADVSGHHLAGIPLSPDAVGVAESWPARVMVERGLRRVLRRCGPVDAFHLRMADVGSLAAHEVCSELTIPMVFSLAPDPHAVVHALDMTDALRRDNFGDVDCREHHWFRIRLVQRLAADAAHTVLFPRPRLNEDLAELVGYDVEGNSHRCTVVAEGIDLTVTESARRDVLSVQTASPDHNDANSEHSAPHPAVEELDRLIGQLAPSRWGLPVLISVGRLHRVKGMATVVEAWASDAELRSRCNLVIVGGDMDAPSTDEREQLDRIDQVLDRFGDARGAVVLAGHQPNDVVARWLAATRFGTGRRVAAHGAYVCGSLKEEFGLALLEAQAAGLVVVAPTGGGPETFVEPGITGVLVDTRSPSEVAAGMSAALDMALRPHSARRAEEVVRNRFTIGAMADVLSGVYASVVSDRSAEQLRS